jgi:hypothetical protein
MSTVTHATLLEIRSMLTQMLGNASDQVRMAAALAQRVRELPPPDAELLSRPVFERAGLWSFCCNFFNLEENATESQPIRIPHDCWIRGVDICVLPSLSFVEVPTTAIWYQAAVMRALLCQYGTNWRGLVDVDWRVPSDQGFVSDGRGDTLGPAAQLSGDGEFSVALDWDLDREDTIIVRCSNQINRIIDPTCDTYIERTLPWVAVAFWAEER